MRPESDRLFFVSYAASDQAWATWIAWQLENAGYPTLLQAWDLVAGSKFVREMQESLAKASATIAVLSDEYVTKVFPSAQWTAAFAVDPSGKERRLIPVRVDLVRPSGLLASNMVVDLCNASDEGDAVDLLLKGVGGDRRKPKTSPPPSGRGKKLIGPMFPGNSPALARRPGPQEHRRDPDEEVEIEIRVSRRFDDFDPPEQERFLKALRSLLAVDYALQVTKVARGSVLVTMKLRRRDAFRLFVLHHIGRLRKSRIRDVTIAESPSISIDDALRQTNPPEAQKIAAGKRERGKVVFVDTEKGYGIIERKQGGFVKFALTDAPSLVKPPDVSLPRSARSFSTVVDETPMPDIAIVPNPSDRSSDKPK